MMNPNAAEIEQYTSSSLLIAKNDKKFMVVAAPPTQTNLNIWVLSNDHLNLKWSNPEELSSVNVLCLTIANHDCAVWLAS